MQKFGIADINNDLLPKLVLKDNLGTRIPAKHFKEIILNFHSGSNFFISATVENGIVRNEAVDMVTPHMLETYFIKNFNDLLFHKNTAKLSEKHRRAIINGSVSFMDEVFGLKNISKVREVTTARATVILFPALKNKMAEDEGIVSYLNFISNQSFSNSKYLF